MTDARTQDDGDQEALDASRALWARSSQPTETQPTTPTGNHVDSDGNQPLSRDEDLRQTARALFGNN